MDSLAPATAIELTKVRTRSGPRVALVAVPLTLAVVVGLAIFGGPRAAEPAIQTAAGPLASRTVAVTTTVTAPIPPRAAYVPWPAIPHLDPLRATRNGRLPLLLPWIAGARSTQQLAR